MNLEKNTIWLKKGDELFKIQEYDQASRFHSIAFNIDPNSKCEWLKNGDHLF